MLSILMTRKTHRHVIILLWLKFMLPYENFGRSNEPKDGSMCTWSIFQGCECRLQIVEKCFEKNDRTVWGIFVWEPWLSCVFDMHIVMRSPMRCRLTHARPLTRLARTTFNPCGKQHFREIATPDWAGQITNLTYWWVCSHLRKVLTQSGVDISRKGCFPHGL